jgi:hypothetical protein
MDQLDKLKSESTRLARIDYLKELERNEMQEEEFWSSFSID